MEIVPVALPVTTAAVGIDVGLETFAVLSDGTAIENARYYREAEKTLRVAQRRVERRKKGSVRRKKAVRLLQRHRHISETSAPTFITKRRANWSVAMAGLSWKI